MRSEKKEALTNLLSYIIFFLTCIMHLHQATLSSTKRLIPEGRLERFRLASLFATAPRRRRMGRSCHLKRNRIINNQPGDFRFYVVLLDHSAKLKNNFIYLKYNNFGDKWFVVDNYMNHIHSLRQLNGYLGCIAG